MRDYPQNTSTLYAFVQTKMRKMKNLQLEGPSTRYDNSMRVCTDKMKKMKNLQFEGPSTRYDLSMRVLYGQNEENEKPST